MWPCCPSPPESSLINPIRCKPSNVIHQTTHLSHPAVSQPSHWRHTLDLVVKTWINTHLICHTRKPTTTGTVFTLPYGLKKRDPCPRMSWSLSILLSKTLYAPSPSPYPRIIIVIAIVIVEYDFLPDCPGFENIVNIDCPTTIYMTENTCSRTDMLHLAISGWNL